MYPDSVSPQIPDIADGVRKLLIKKDVLFNFALLDDNLKMNSVGRNVEDGNCNCRVKLNHVLAIVMRKEGCRGDPGDFWMYENGYLLFQGLISSNSICWWNNGLNGATKNLVYYGYVNPGALLVAAEPCALEILRNAWSRRVLQPPPGYQIVALEDIEESTSASVPQTQWTPLPEAVCSVVLRLSSQGRPAGIETIRESLIMAFPHVSPPSEQALYDTLVQLTKEKKLYNTSSGYYIVTPERRRSRSQSRGRRRDDNVIESLGNKTMLMSTEEAVVMVHGDMATIRDGNVTHQCIQTNLADVICGGNTSDKILYPRAKRRSSSFPSPRSPDRRGSFKLWNSNRRLRRSASTRTIAKHYVDTSSSTEYPNSGQSTPTPKKGSLLSRLFRRSKRSQCQIGTFGAQFPPTEWFNSKAVHLHSVGTQTITGEKENGINISSYLETSSSTLPRNHRRQHSTDLTFGTPTTGSRENSPIPSYITAYATSTLPRKHPYRSRDSSRKSISRPNLSTNKTNHVLAEVKKPPPPEKEEKNNVNERLSINEEENKNLSSIDNSGPSSIESHKTGSSLTSGPSSLESHKTVINRTVDSPKKYKKEVPHSNSFTLQVTTNQNGSNFNNKIFVQNSPVRSVITFENGQVNESKGKDVLIINNDKKDTTKNTNNQMNNNENTVETMNNRKLSLQLPHSKENLNYHNVIKNVQQVNSNSNPDSPIGNTFSKNSFTSTPSTPTKSYENIPIFSSQKQHKNDEKFSVKTVVGSDGNISCKENADCKENFPSLSDLTFNFTSLAAQKILKGVSINSVDTLVELNMAANLEKQNNCDVVHTDFGLV